MNLSMFVLLLLGYTLAPSCKDDSDGGNSGGSSRSESGYNYARTKIISSSLASSDLKFTQSDEACSFSMDIYRANGSCITPSSVSGIVNRVNLNGLTRILGPDENSETQGNILPGVAVDFSNLDAELVGDNQLIDQYNNDDSFDHASVNMHSLKVKFTVPRSGNTFKYVTMFVATHPQPFTNAEAISCVPESERSQERYNVETIDGIEFERGDYLFCLKDTEDATCSASDWKWIDSSSNSLVDTRPSSPRQHKWLTNDAITCTQEDDGRYNFNIGPIYEVSSFASADTFKLSADYSHGEISNQWPEEKFPKGDIPEGGEDIEGNDPYLIYYHTSKNGDKTEGNDLLFTLDINPSQMVFVEGISDLENESDLGKILANTYTKSQWAFQQKAENNIEGWDPSHVAGTSASPTVEVSGGTDEPETKLESSFE